MAKLTEVIIQQLGTGHFLLEKFTSDFSDEEYFKIPIPGTNHPAWVMGHLACSEDSAVSGIAGKEMRIAQDTHDLFKGGSECIADASKYPSRGELDEMLKNSHAHLLEALQTFDESKWNDPSPEGFPKDFFPTLGSVWAMQSTHQFWHIGQLSVCRRALSKPMVLFGP